MADCLLELRDVDVRSGREALLDRVSFDVSRGTIHVIVGANGAGKSTLLSAILGRIPFSGSIRCHYRRSGTIGYVPQSFAIDRTLVVTVAELLALSRQTFPPVAWRIRREVRANIEALLAKVELTGFGTRRLSLLSGGEMQRVLLANAMDPVPELLVLDEPASGLDRGAADRLEETLRSLRSEHGVTVLMVSHDMGEVRRLADRVTVLARSVKREGTPDEVLKSGASTPWE